MDHSLQTIRALRLHPRGLQVLGCALLLGALASEVQAQSTTVTSPNAAFSRPEVTGLGGVVPTAPVRLRVWGFEVYDARLWTPVGFRHSTYTQFPFALELQYLRKLEGTAIASRSIDEMRRVGSFSDAQAQSWLTAMRELFPDVRQGERITGLNLPGVGAEFWFNGQRVGVVKDPAFARLFFGIWLDERTSEPKMRAQLLQGLQP
ncbi:chalcone isomerase family protein [Limnohabitans sp. 63ED37-2]|uniref:chalcone isomerase family protein n=1 Tax=Limnohabitans sp. 63ED37-2 TaxID=1678128 RepID=UPI0009ECA276|nr:chalcone isomerase family protein [Limnohabitans sp. 63ED37-2]